MTRNLSDRIIETPDRMDETSLTAKELATMAYPPTDQAKPASEAEAMDCAMRSVAEAYRTGVVIFADAMRDMWYAGSEWRARQRDQAAPSSEAVRELVNRLRSMREKPPADFKRDIWYCKVGQTTRDILNDAMSPRRGADGPMRAAISQAFRELTGKWPDFIFSGWGQTLTESEQAVVDNREPEYEKTDYAVLTASADTLESLADHSQAPEPCKAYIMGEGEPCGTCQACRNAEYSRDKVVSALELQNKRVAAAWKLCDRVTQRGEGPTFAYDLAVKIETALDACYEESKNAG